MRIYMLSLLLATGVAAQPDEALPALVRIDQAAPRSSAKLKLPHPHSVGPTIPGLRQGAVPQGLAFWAKQNWLLISCYFDDGRPSVVVVLDNKTGKLVRCLTLVEAGGKGHTGHVGGLAVSEKYLWIGSGPLYRAPLADIVAAQPVAHLRLQEPFRAESTASSVAYHDKRVWAGEFVLEDEIKGKPPHHMKDRNGADKYAWLTGYELDANEDLVGVGGGRSPPPAAILSVRQRVQGLAFLDGHIILSVSYGRTNHSTLAVYTDPLHGEQGKPHRTVKVGDETVPVWFLDGKNRVREIDFPPMSEGITAIGKRLGVVCESGAEKYQKDGRGPLDSVIFIAPLAGK